EAPAVAYHNDFQGTVGGEWSNTATATTPVGNRRFLGQFANDTVSLSLGSLPAHTELVVVVDLLVIGGLGGNSGPDLWSLRVGDGPTLVHTTFSTMGSRQAYPDSYPGGDNPQHTGAAEAGTLGYASGGDVYTLRTSFPHTAGSLVLNFSGDGL